MSERVTADTAALRKALRPADVADRWQCSERHVRNLAREGQLRHFRAGGKLLRFRIEDVEEYEQCGLSSTVKNTPSSGGTEANDIAARLVRMIR